MSEPGPSRRLLTAAAVADRLDVSVKTVRRWIHSGELAVYRFGRCVRISEADLKDFRERHHKY